MSAQRESREPPSHEALLKAEWRASSIVVLVVLTYVLVALAVAAFAHYLHIRDEMAHLCSELEQVQRTVEEETAQAYHSVLRFLESRDPADLRRRGQSLLEIASAFRQLDRVLGDEASLLAEQALPAVQTLQAYEERAISLAREAGPESARAHLLDSSYEEAKRQLHAALAQLTDERAPHWRRHRVAYQAAAGTSILTGGTVIVLSIVAWSGLIQRLLRWRRSALSLLAELSTTTRALRETEERYRLALAGANDGIWDWDLRTNRVFYSHRWKWLLGYAEHEIGESPAEWYSRIHSDDRKRFQEAISQHLEGKAPLLDVEIRMVTREGHWRWMQVRGVAILDEHQRPVRLAGSISDVTRRKVAEEELRHGALHDPLTQLANRAYFLAFLERAVASVLRHPEQQFAILFIDLDGFKSVNDQFGHAVGDEVLACIAARIADSVRPTDVVARYGGDEFVVLVEDIGEPRHVYDLAHRIESVIRQPIAVAGTQITLGASIGIAMSSQPFREPADLIALADARMYEVKAARKEKNTE